MIVTECLEPLCRLTLLHMHKGPGKFSSHYFISHLSGGGDSFLKCTIWIVAKVPDGLPSLGDLSMSVNKPNLEFSEESSLEWLEMSEFK